MSVKEIQVGSAKAAPGRIGQGYLKVGELAMNAELRVPVMIVNGRQDGPVLWLNGAVHGDELNAFMAIRNVCGAVATDDLAGALVCTPVCNPLAVQWRNKINPYDFLDLDQQFPGKADGQYSQRTAYALFKEMQEVADYLISFHTVGTSFAAEPYSVYKFAPGLSPQMCESIEAMALAFGVRLNCRVDLSSAVGEVPGGVGGALDVNCSRAGIPAFMAEVGSGGRFQPEAIAIAEAGIRHVMAHLGMAAPVTAEKADQMIVTKRGFLYSDYAGFFEGKVQPGEKASKNAVIGNVVDLFADIGVIRAPSDAYILMSRQEPVLHVGDRVAFLGLEWIAA